MSPRTRRLRALAAVGAMVVGVFVAGTAQAASTVTLRLSASKTALKFNVTKLTAARPGKVRLVMSNPSAIPHDIALKGKGLKKPVVGKVVGKGKTSTITATLKKGSYTFYCSVPGHEAAGMKGKLTVR
jgi:plastocyanin